MMDNKMVALLERVESAEDELAACRRAAARAEYRLESIRSTARELVRVAGYQINASRNRANDAEYERDCARRGTHHLLFPALDKQGCYLTEEEN